MNTAPTTYAIRVHGHLDDHWSAWLGNPDMTRHEDGTTTITISIADQAQLHGVLAGLRDIGAVITELHITDGAGSSCEHPSSQLDVAAGEVSAEVISPRRLAGPRQPQGDERGAISGHRDLIAAGARHYRLLPEVPAPPSAGRHP